MSTRRSLSLGQQNALRLALVFVLFEVLAALAVVFLLMLPMARRASGDLAGLMVLAAQTWSELPPDTRPAFERALTIEHGLRLAREPPEGGMSFDWYRPYLRELESQLTTRSGRAVDLSRVVQAGEAWFWVGLPSGGRTLWLGFPSSRVGPRPLAAAGLTLAVGMLLAGLAAWWLGQRIVAPIKAFDAAAATLGRGETPALLPETGPRELAALARRFNRLSLQVHDLLEARTTLLAGLSHDLRTPLARMRLALEMFDRRPGPVWVERLERDIEEMSRLVGDVLELARGLGQETAVPVDVAGLLRELAEPARAAGAQVEVSCPDLVLNIASATLRRVLGNLLDNALRYGGDGPVELRVEAVDGGWRIGVLDRGPGIPAGQMEAVFRPFHRVETSRSPTTGGSGLGLAIVRQLAQANGMQVWLENRRDGGLAAWVGLPAAG